MPALCPAAFTMDPGKGCLAAVEPLECPCPTLPFAPARSPAPISSASPVLTQVLDHSPGCWVRRACRPQRCWNCAAQPSPLATMAMAASAASTAVLGPSPAAASLKVIAAIKAGLWAMLLVPTAVLTLPLCHEQHSSQPLPSHSPTRAECHPKPGAGAPVLPGPRQILSLRGCWPSWVSHCCSQVWREE